MSIFDDRFDWSGVDSPAPFIPVAETSLVGPSIYTPDYSEYSDNSKQYFSNDVNFVGNANNLPMISTPPQTAINSPYNAITDALGAIRGIARDAGTVVGDIRRTIDQAPKDYNRAAANAQSGNKMGQIFQYMTPAEKIMLAVAVIGLGFAAYSAMKK